jgi:signal transduction histidine kinase
MHRHAHATCGRVRVSRDGENIILEISDNGVGIPPEKLARFNQTGAGMGVGLTGIWERVRDLGGQAELTAGSQGTFIRISVPFSKRRRKPATPRFSS